MDIINVNLILNDIHFKNRVSRKYFRILYIKVDKLRFDAKLSYVVVKTFIEAYI